jgi:hypothetical protein
LRFWRQTQTGHLRDTLYIEYNGFDAAPLYQGWRDDPMAITPTALTGKDREIWERLPRETEQAYRAFRAYLEMPSPRSMRTVAQQLNRSLTLLARWSTRWRWQRRLESYLADQEERRIRKYEADREEATERHINISKLLQNAAITRMQTLDVARISPETLAKFLALAVDMERKALGLDKLADGGKNVNRSTMTQLAPSETRELRSDIQERLEQLSPVSRDLIRQLTMKTLRLLELQVEIHGGSPQETKPSHGTQQGD